LKIWDYLNKGKKVNSEKGAATPSASAEMITVFLRCCQDLGTQQKGIKQERLSID